jgi:hypothetical protein
MLNRVEGRFLGEDVMRNFLLLGGSIAILGAVIPPAEASTLSLNTWYAGRFGSTAGVGLFGGGVTGTSAPDGHPTTSAPDIPWTITLSQPGKLTVTDVEESGDQFTLTFTGATSETVTTSTPVANAANVGECISCALSNPDFSSGVFALNAGTTTFNGAPIFSRAPGTFDFEITTVPEPSTWAMMALGFSAVGFLGHRKAKTAQTAV